jgi:hypothetical protein
MEEDNRRKLEEAEKVKREREAAKQAAVKAQLDEEQRRKREEEERRRREKESMAAALEEAKRKEQARAVQKAPTVLAATAASTCVDIAMQRPEMFSLKQTAAAQSQQTPIAALIAPTAVPPALFSPQKPAAASSLFGGVKSLISTVGGSSGARLASVSLRLQQVIRIIVDSFYAQASLALNRRLRPAKQPQSSSFRHRRQCLRKRLRQRRSLQRKRADLLHMTFRTTATGACLRELLLRCELLIPALFSQCR